MVEKNRSINMICYVLMKGPRTEQSSVNGISFGALNVWHQQPPPFLLLVEGDELHH
jgi:hypothetical protein